VNLVLGYITHESREAARRVVDHLLEKRLIACANLVPIESVYRWKGRLEHAEEVVSVVKTRPEHWERVKAEIAAVHPYEVPCILKLAAEANEPFRAWVEDETGSR
jgi:periplasmic divalent cation tolerance protein